MSEGALFYTEQVYRYQILAHDELPEAHKQAYLADGINPDDIWSLIFSSQKLDSAEKSLQDLENSAPSWRVYKLVDAGKTTYIDRPVY